MFAFAFQLLEEPRDLVKYLAKKKAGGSEKGLYSILH